MQCDDKFSLTITRILYCANRTPLSKVVLETSLKKTYKNQTAEACGINRWKQSDTVASSFGYSLTF